MNPIFILCLLALSNCAVNIEVKVKQGKILGTRGDTIFESRLYFAFYGVPYARAPIGKLRFQDPKPVKKWKKPFDARSVYHGACAQPHIVHKKALHGNEDCLRLNIYTPYLPKSENDSLRPVVVWVHGYAFASSLSHIYGADFLIDNDVLFVSVTHRIGVFGFLKINDSYSTGNMGLKDIVMALKWVKNNIKYFGGDNKQVTVMGNSSAGSFLSLLLMTKLRKLFSKIILQSGASFSPSMFQSNSDFEKTQLEKELAKITSKKLLQATTKDIVTASQNIYDKKQIINIQRPIVPFTPSLEIKSNKSIIGQRPENFYKSESMYFNIPMLIGFNSQESISEIIPFLHNPKLLRSFTSFFKYMVPFSDGCAYNYTTSIYKSVAEKIKLRYFKNNISEKSLNDFQKYTTDLLVYPIYKFIKAYLNSNNKVYVYKFNYAGNFNIVKKTSSANIRQKIDGASTGDEICYILNCEPVGELYGKIANDVNHQDRKLIKDMSMMWTNFVKYGDPTPISRAGNYSWLPMTSLHDNIFLITKNSKMISSNYMKNMYEFWNNIYDKFYSKIHCEKKIHEEL